jgi:hypothetical protein
MLGFVVCCAEAGVSATVTAANNANRPNEVRLIVLIV